jgi:hypothetical protein
MGGIAKLFVDRMHRLARCWSNRQLEVLASLFSGDVVNVSAWDDRDKEGRCYQDYFVHAKGYYYTNYHGTRGLQQRENEYLVDLTDDLPEGLRKRFDVVFNHTTLEHVFDIQKAFSNLCAMSRDIVILVVPFCQIQHETDSYKDYWRFTPSCVRELFRRNGMQAIYEAESCHKNAAIYLFFVASRNPDAWKGRVPISEPIREAGAWIGYRWLPRLYAAVRRRFRGR